MSAREHSLRERDSPEFDEGGTERPALTAWVMHGTACMSVLLLGANYYGTLAAARAYGAKGIDVIMADESRSALCLSSRFVTERLTCPKVSDTSSFLRWLMEQGHAHGGSLVLYPTTDHLAWLFAAHRAELDQVFRIYHPDEEAIFGLLDKHRLSLAASAVGLELPFTLVAEPIEKLEQLARSMKFPILLKPRTQVFLRSGVKGVLVPSPGELKEKIAEFLRFTVYEDALRERHPEVSAPLLQEYLPAAETSVFSVSGFRTREGVLMARGAMKVLQRPRKLGIGLCFESRPLDSELLEKLSALCEKVGYFGTFEAEFIISGSRRLLIDFNPRFYSQMAFDQARGLDHALLAYYSARGQHAQVAKLLDQAQAWRSKGPEAYCHRGLLELVLGLQGASGRMTRAQVRHWRDWIVERRPHLIDATWSRDDPMPAVVDWALWLSRFAHHPRSFVVHYLLNR